MAKFEEARKALNGASAGLAIAVAFVNVALLVVKLVQTVTEEVPVLQSDAEETESLEESES